MALLLSLFLLLNQTGGPPKQSVASVSVSVTNQKQIKNRTHLPWANRQFTFRLTNKSSKTIYVYGFKSFHGFFPSGYLIRFDREKNQWVNPAGDTAHPSFKDIEDTEPDIYVLRPGKSVNFTNLAERFYVRSRYQRMIYVSFNEEEEPQMIKSEEFVLR